MKVLVIGGGIGGLTLAQALKSAGVQVEVYERNPAAGDWLEGYRIHIDHFGSRALYRCLPKALWQAFVATAGDPGGGIAFHDNKMRELLFVDDSIMNGAATTDDGRHYAVSRKTLRTLLLAGLDDVVHFGRTFERYEMTPDGRVTAYFTDGSTADGDLLIGADGANSRVRQQFLPHAKRITTNAIGIAARLPLTDETRKWVPQRVQNGMNIALPLLGKFMFSAVFDGRRRTTEALGAGLELDEFGLKPESLLDDLQDYVLVAIVAHRNAYPSNAGDLSGQALQDLAGQLLAGWHPDLRRLMSEADPDSTQLIEFKTSTRVQPWPSAQVTLLGDAIHNMTPAMGLGANTALRDAALLSDRLVAVHNGESALLPAVHQYEAQMLRYGFEAVHTSLRFAKQAISSNIATRQAMRGFLKVCSAAPRVKEKSFGRPWTDDVSAAKPS